jgi:hypothetical protein
MEAALCIYCRSPADSLEHPLPAALGEFKDAPLLDGCICKKCNNTKLGLLDEQLVRSGPEAFLRKLFGVHGRETHDKVNPFERGSAGGQRLDLRSLDQNTGGEIALEYQNGSYRNLREMVLVDSSGKTHHLPIREGTSPDELRAAGKRLDDVVQPVVSIRCFYTPEEKEWVLRLIRDAWPDLPPFTEDTSVSNIGGWTLAKFTVTDRYYRAIAKIGFHYFLTQFPEYKGHESIFDEIREFITTDGLMDRVNQFVKCQPDPVAPEGWLEHRVAAGIVPGGCSASVQLFISREYPASVCRVYLALDPLIADCRAASHSYRYNAQGETPTGKYCGSAHRLDLVRS